MFSGVIECLEQSNRKQIDCHRVKTIGYKINEQRRLQNIRIEICKWKYDLIRLVLAGFSSTKLTLNYVNKFRCN